MIQTFEFYGTGRQINAQGRFFRYEQGADGEGVTQLRITIDGNRIGTLEPGDALELPQEATRWDIEPVSSGCVGVVRIGNVRITSDKLQGVVSVVDAAAKKTDAALSFMASTGVTSAAGQFAYLQVWNRSATRSIYINAAQFWTAADAEVTLGGSSSPAENPVGLPTSARSKSIGGTFAESVTKDVLLFAFQSNLLAHPVVDFSLARFMCKAGTTFDLKPTEPIKLRPGRGLFMRCGVQAVALNANFEWFEDAA